GTSFVARRRPVEVLGRADGRRAVEGELAPGERVITLGHEGIVDGAAVELAGVGPVREAETGERPPRPRAPGEEVAS
ncbi:MAG TPA: hypothetical protein VHM02_04180, partial [Thermoanaerobaculia bacterium]|nr:hypothetical protein [Thermoanaerobaculia bacterium]